MQQIQSKLDSLLKVDQEIQEMSMVNDESEGTILKVLLITEHLLQRTNESLIENGPLCGLLKEVILANIKHDNSLIQLGVLRCLALCCILDKNLAKQNIILFIDCLRERQGDIKFILQALFDIGVTFGLSHFSEGKVDQLLINTLKECLNAEIERGVHLSYDQDESAGKGKENELFVIGVEGFCKWFLLKISRDVKVLSTLVELYFRNSTQASPHALQCLTYFLQAFAFSGTDNQLLLAKVFILVIRQLSRLPKHEHVVTLLTVAQQLLDWTDSNHVIKQPKADGRRKQEVNEEGENEEDQGEGEHPHARLALEILLTGLGEPSSVLKVLCQTLGKIKVPKNTKQTEIKQLKVLAEIFAEGVTDKTNSNYVNKFRTSVSALDKNPEISLSDEEISSLTSKMITKRGDDDDDGSEDDYESSVVIETKKKSVRTSRKTKEKSVEKEKEIDELFEDSD